MQGRVGWQKMEPRGMAAQGTDKSANSLRWQEDANRRSPSAERRCGKKKGSGE